MNKEEALEILKSMDMDFDAEYPLFGIYNMLKFQTELLIELLPKDDQNKEIKAELATGLIRSVRDDCPYCNTLLELDQDRYNVVFTWHLNSHKGDKPK